jgi:hypothetical protein
MVQGYLLTLNLDKTYSMQFSTKDSNTTGKSITYSNNQIAITSDIKFLGLMITSTLSWKGHTDLLMTKLRPASYVVRSIMPYMSFESMKMVYFSYFHSILIHGLIFWGNSPLCIHIF